VGASGVKIVLLELSGFAGAWRGLRLHLATLPAGEWAALETLVAGSGLEGACEPRMGRGYDLRQNGLAIKRDGIMTRLAGDESCLPERVRPLVTAFEAWGRFAGRVVARWEEDGRTMTLLEPFAHVDPQGVSWDARPWIVLDGTSISRAFSTVIGGPFAGEFPEASFVHDEACVDRDRPWRAVHRVFSEASWCGGVDAVKAKTMNYGGFHFGPR